MSSLTLYFTLLQGNCAKVTKIGRQIGVRNNKLNHKCEINCTSPPAVEALNWFVIITPPLTFR